MLRRLFTPSLCLAAALSAACTGGQSGSDRSAAVMAAPCHDPALRSEPLDASVPEAQVSALIAPLEQNLEQSALGLWWQSPLSGTSTLELTLVEHGESAFMSASDNAVCLGGVGSTLTLQARSTDGRLDLALHGSVIRAKGHLSVSVESDAQAFADSTLASAVRRARPDLEMPDRRLRLWLVWLEGTAPASFGNLEIVGTESNTSVVAAIGAR